MNKPPIIFLAFANDREDNTRYLRGLATELSGIRMALKPAKQAGKVEIVERANASLSDIIDVFTDPEYQGRIKIFHYAGHANSYQLMLESAKGTAEYANIEGFSRFLARQNSLSLVLLNACSTKGQVDYLLNAGIPSVIATSTVISDNIATHFAIRFYKSIASYLPASQAYQDASDEIRTLYGERNYRAMYLDALTEAELPAQLPWDVYPENCTNWRIEPPVSQVAVSGTKLGPFSYTMVDRNEQKDEFDNSYFTGLSQQVRKPQIYLIHGLKEDRHESLVTRFSFESIGKNNYIRPYEIKNWPTAGDGQNLLKMRILSQLETLNWANKNASTLVANDLIYHPFFSTQKNVLLQHNIPGEEWNQMTFELLEWYITQFWNVEIKDATVPNFAIFINIMYSPDQVKSGFFSGLFSKNVNKDKIIEWLQKLSSQYANIKLLSELKGVKKDHFDTWILESNLSDYQEFVQIANQIFTNGGGLAMASVETTLKKTIDTFLAKNAGLYG